MEALLSPVLKVLLLGVLVIVFSDTTFTRERVTRAAVSSSSFWFSRRDRRRNARNVLEISENGYVASKKT